MGKIDPIIVNQEASVYLPVDHTIVQGNICDALCNMARFGAEIPDVEPPDVLPLLSDATASPSDWYKQRIARVTRVKESETGPQIETMEQFMSVDLALQEAFGNKDAVRMIKPLMRQFVSRFVVPAKQIHDYGTYLRGMFSANPLSFGHTYGITPSTGYAKQITLPSLQVWQLEDCFKLPHFASDYTKAWASFFMILDLWRLKKEMFIPKRDVKKKDDMLERAMGANEILVDFALMTQAYPVTYLEAAKAHAFKGVAAQRFRDFCRASYLDIASPVNDALVARADAVLANMQAEPAHPYTTYLESCFATGTLRTRIGVKDPIYVTCKDDFLVALTDDEGRLKIDPATKLPTYDLPTYLKYRSRADTKENNMNAVLANPAARMYVDFLSSLDEIDSQPGAELTTGWGVENRGGADYTHAKTSLVDGIRALSGSPRLREKVEFQRAMLNWTPISGRIGQVDMAACDVGWTDGFRSSVEPDQALLGLTLLLPISNIRTYGIKKRYVPDFLVNHAPRVYTIPLKGVTTPQLDGYQYENRYMMPGMWMGEPNAENVYYSFAINDFNGKKIKERFKSKAVWYADVNEKVLTPAAVLEVTGFKASDTADAATQAAAVAVWPVRGSDWDPYGFVIPGSQNGRAEVVLSSTWSLLASKYGDSIDDIPYIVRAAEGTSFYHRSLARVSRGRWIYAIGWTGVLLLDKIGFEGEYQFLDDIDATHDMSALDKLLALCPPKREPKPYLGDETNLGIV